MLSRFFTFKTALVIFAASISMISSAHATGGVYVCSTVRGFEIKQGSRNLLCGPALYGWFGRAGCGDTYTVDKTRYVVKYVKGGQSQFVAEADSYSDCKEAARELNAQVNGGESRRGYERENENEPVWSN